MCRLAIEPKIKIFQRCRDRAPAAANAERRDRVNSPTTAQRYPMRLTMVPAKRQVTTMRPNTIELAALTSQGVCAPPAPRAVRTRRSVLDPSHEGLSSLFICVPQSRRKEGTGSNDGRREEDRLPNGRLCDRGECQPTEPRQTACTPVDGHSDQRKYLTAGEGDVDRGGIRRVALLLDGRRVSRRCAGDS